MKSTWIRRIELTIVRRIALGDVDDQSALGPGLADQFHHAFEHAGLGEVLSEFLVPGPVRRNEISLKVDQKDGSLFGLDAFRRRRHRLGLRRRHQSKHRDDRHRNLKPIARNDFCHFSPPYLKSLTFCAPAAATGDGNSWLARNT